MGAVPLRGKGVRAKQIQGIINLAVTAVVAESHENYAVEKKRNETSEICEEKRRIRETRETCGAEKTIRETLDAQRRRRGNCLRLGRKKRAPPRVGPPLACPQLLVALSRASNTYACSGRDRGMPSATRSKETLEACDDTFSFSHFLSGQVLIN